MAKKRCPIPNIDRSFTHGIFEGMAFCSYSARPNHGLRLIRAAGLTEIVDSYQLSPAMKCGLRFLTADSFSLVSLVPKVSGALWEPRKPLELSFPRPWTSGAPWHSPRNPAKENRDQPMAPTKPLRAQHCHRPPANTSPGPRRYAGMTVVGVPVTAVCVAQPPPIFK